VVSDGILDDFEQLLLRGCGSDRETMEELDHETSESLKGTRNSDSWADLDEDTFRCVDINLQFACLIDRRIKES